MMMKTIFSLVFLSSVLMGAVTNRASSIERLLKESVAKELPNVIRVTVQDVRSLEPIPAGAEIISIQPSPPIGYVMFDVSWNEKGQVHHEKGSAMVKAFARVAVAKNPIRHGESFTEANIKFEERELSALKVSGYYSDREALNSVRAKGYLGSNAVVGFSHTEIPLLVSPGQVVDLTNSGKHLTVTARVKALESGRLNQWIKVENPTTRKMMYGRVIGSGLLSLH